MTTLTRPLVCRAVDEYGLAWTTQDPDRIANLFTESAIYVERPFDSDATMRGREAIRNYWNQQIVGKQSNIQFRHVASEIVLDAERKTAVVKWLAEFENIRHKMDQVQKTVRFCQLAKLVFNDDCTKIKYLEEYAQGTSTARYNWPPAGIGSNTSDAALWDMVRNEPNAFATRGKQTFCKICKQHFPSRAQLFVHLRKTRCGADPDSGETINDAQYNPPSSSKRGHLIKLCVSCTYLTRNVQPEDMEKVLYETIQSGARRSFPSVKEEDVLVTWSVAPARAKHAVVNVASFNVPETMLLSVGGSCDLLLEKWNEGLLSLGAVGEEEKVGEEETKTKTKTRTKEDETEDETEGTIETETSFLSCSSKKTVVRVLLRCCYKVGQSFTPAKVCEFEKYEALVPLRVLLCKEEGKVGKVGKEGRKTTSTASTRKEELEELSQKIKHAVRYFSNAEKSFHNFTTMKLGSGKKSTKLRIKRVRCCGIFQDPVTGMVLASGASANAMPDEQWATITVPLKWYLPNVVSKIIGAIVSVVRGEMTSEEVVQSFEENHVVEIPSYPTQLIYLITPNMTRFETKNKIQVTLGKGGGRATKDMVFSGDEKGVNVVSELGRTLIEWEKEENILSTVY